MSGSLLQKFTQRAKHKLYPFDNVHIYAYDAELDPEKHGQWMTACTILVDYQTGLIQPGKCTSLEETQKEEDRLCDTNRYFLLDSKLCFCEAQKSQKDNAFIVAFFNVNKGHGTKPLLTMFDFYACMVYGGDDDMKKIRSRLKEDPELLNHCKEMAAQLETATFGDMLNSIEIKKKRIKNY